jgi:hypothetical protein
MSDGEPIRSEVTPNYRTLDEPTKLLGLSIGQWGAVAIAAGFAYLLLLIKPFPWRVNVSLIVIFGGAPMVLLLLREQGALSASRLVSAVCRWRVKPALLLAVDAEQPPSGGVVVLDEAPVAIGGDELVSELPWLDPDPKETQ